ncbi:MAG: S41 family peptidase [Actinomycetes bacterium]
MATPIKDFLPLVKGANRTIVVGIIVLAIIVGFAAGDFAGKSRHKSTVDEALAMVIKRDTLAPNRKILERAAIEAILKSTGDRWSNYIPLSTVDIFSAQIQGRYSGVGLWLRRTESGLLEVSNVDPGSPASVAGIKVRDLLTSINGIDVSTDSVSTAIAALRGNAKSTVALKLERDQVSYSVSVKRAKVLNGDVLASQIRSHIVYLQVTAVSSHSADDIATALNKYPHDKGIILDLRDNPGGLIDEAVNVVSLFLSSGPVVSYTQKGLEDIALVSTNPSPDSAPMTVLINRSTASSAEVITGALQDRNRAVVLGEKSYGKGTVQEVVNLMDGSQIELTVGKYRTPSGKLIDGLGINPDLKVSDSVIISKALQVLGGLVSLENGKGALTSR